MEISDELISHLESLAHIELDTDEHEDCRRDFEKINTPPRPLRQVDFPAADWYNRASAAPF